MLSSMDTSAAPAAEDSSAPSRKRISRACNTCNKRKVKCDGQRPECSACVRTGITCSYDRVLKRRGPKPGVSAMPKSPRLEEESNKRPNGVTVSSKTSLLFPLAHAPIKHLAGTAGSSDTTLITLANSYFNPNETQTQGSYAPMVDSRHAREKGVSIAETRHSNPDTDIAARKAPTLLSPSTTTMLEESTLSKELPLVSSSSSFENGKGGTGKVQGSTRTINSESCTTAIDTTALHSSTDQLIIPGVIKVTADSMSNTLSSTRPSSLKESCSSETNSSQLESMTLAPPLSVVNNESPISSPSSSGAQPRWRYLDSFYKQFYPFTAVIPKEHFYKWVPFESSFLLEAMYALGARELGELSASLKYFERAKQSVFDVMLRPSFSSIHGLLLTGIYALCEFIERNLSSS
jgi:hypothetical protein